MFEAQVLGLLERYLGKYVYGLDAESLRISVWRGDVELTNLRLKPEALDDLQLPIAVKSGLLGRLTLKVRAAATCCACGARGCTCMGVFVWGWGGGLLRAPPTRSVARAAAAAWDGVDGACATLLPQHFSQGSRAAEAVGAAPRRLACII